MTNLAPEDFLAVLSGAACAVGNSSSFVRDSSYFGTPVVLVGNRQNGRETAENAVRVGASQLQIHEAVTLQLKHGRYPASDLYGDGYVAERIARALVQVEPYAQKRLCFEEGGVDAPARARR